MKIGALSDLHGYLPEDIQPVDILAVAGDIFPVKWQNDVCVSLTWLVRNFLPWVKNAPADKVIVVPGNHDFFFWYSYLHKILIDIDGLIQTPEYGVSDKLVYLIDKSYEYQGKVIYGTPWIQNLSRWAFYAQNTADKYKNIPAYVDLLVCHQPPRVDKVGCTNPYMFNETNFGDKNLTAVLDDKNRIIKNLVCGHVHSGIHGGVPYRDTNVYNVSLKNEAYAVAYDITYFDI